ncbi:sensor domain-containing diguanylate cyclase [Athalassotoga saccharophila]|uniref:Diguanylate cyclase DgcP n=1 Tax=Athalassotoga saccharophila TaxID=1441386 RepID=A0A6N4TEA2_9BACT|nr:diguanylate cyclase [Athalassotoga saccharophila]BBJ29067.1 diguanylate cyclase DgcP [Athalassotoga saccharophila]
MINQPKIRLILELVIISAIISGIAYIAYYSIEENAKEKIEDQSMLLSIVTDEFMGYYVTAGVAFNNMILQNPDLIHDRPNLDYVLSNYTVHLASQIKSVEVLSPAGSLIGSSPNASKIELSDLYFGQKDLGIGTISTDTRLLPVGYRIKEDGKIVAILVMNVDIKALFEKWAQSTKHSDVSLYLFRLDGKLLWSSVNNTKLKIGRNFGYSKIDGMYLWIEPVSGIEGFSVAVISSNAIMILWYRDLIYLIVIWLFVAGIIYIFYRKSIQYEQEIQSLVNEQRFQIEELTEQKKRFEILKKMYDSVILVEKEILNAKDENAFLQSVCDRITETGLFDFAGIAIPNDKKVLRYKFLSGNGKQTVLKVQNEMPNNIRALLVSEIAFKSQKIYVGSPQDISTFEITEYEKVWMEKVYKANEWKSGISIPIFQNEKIFGILSVFSKEEDFFTDDVKALAEIFARLLGNALENMEARAKLISQLFESQYLATHDPLTGLLNRIGIMERVDNVIARSKREKKYMAFGIMDIDDFKLVNDIYGHSAGDALLIEFGGRIESLLRGEDLIGRIGGDEFVMVILVNSEEDIDALMSRFERSLAQPFKAGDEDIYIKVSAGFTLYPKDDNSFDALLRHADKAMYIKKEMKNKREKFWGIYKEDI